MTTGDHYPQIFPGIGGGVPIACLSAAGCLWAGVWRLCGCGPYGLFSLTWMMLQIGSILIIIVSIRSTYMCLN